MKNLINQSKILLPFDLLLQPTEDTPFSNTLTKLFLLPDRSPWPSLHQQEPTTADQSRRDLGDGSTGTRSVHVPGIPKDMNRCIECGRAAVEDDESISRRPSAAF